MPGAWHGPYHLRLLVDELAGLDVHTVALPSSGDDPATLGDMYADAKVIAAAAAAIDGPVVVMAHSYGGIPTTQALSRARNVQRIIYLAAFQLDAEQSLLSVSGSPETWAKMHEIDGVVHHLEHKSPLEAFYNDVDSTLAEQALAKLGYLSYAAVGQPLTEVAWKTIPSTYIICEADVAIPASKQEEFAKRANRIHRLNTSHSPFLSQPASLAQLIRQELESR